MGFVILMIIGAYLLISAGVVAGAITYAQQRGKSTIRWGASAVLVMFLIPGWDWIPTIVAHKYYCEKDAGFWVYKTLDQWKAENPGIVETLVANKQPVVIQNAYVLNQRFNWVIKQNPFFPLNYSIREEQQVVDSKTGEVLARYVDFSVSHERRQAGWVGWKMWLDSPHCSGGGKNQDDLRNFRDNFYGRNK